MYIYIYLLAPPPPPRSTFLMSDVNSYLKSTHFVIFEMNSYMNPHTNGTYEQYT